MKAVVAFLFSSLPLGAPPAQPALPASAYPAGAVVTELRLPTNAQMDTGWGFTTDKLPIFHTRSQDDLHRTAGFDEYVTSTHRGDGVFWGLWASTYASGTDPTTGRPYAEAAAADAMKGASRGVGLAPIHTDATIPGGSLTLARVSDGDDTMDAVIAQHGSIEVEAVCDFPARYAGYERAHIQPRLIAQAKLALRVEAGR